MELKINMYIHTIALYMYAKFHVNWSISIRDICKKLKKRIFGLTAKNRNSRNLIINMGIHTTPMYILVKFYVNWLIFKRDRANSFFQLFGVKCIFGHMAKNIACNDLKIILLQTSDYTLLAYQISCFMSVGLFVQEEFTAPKSAPKTAPPPPTTKLKCYMNEAD